MSFSPYPLPPHTRLLHLGVILFPLTPLYFHVINHRFIFFLLIYVFIASISFSLTLSTPISILTWAFLTLMSRVPFYCNYLLILPECNGLRKKCRKIFSSARGGHINEFAILLLLSLSNNLATRSFEWM